MRLGRNAEAVASYHQALALKPDHVNAPCNGRVSGRLHGFDRESRSVTYRIADEPSRGRVKLVDASIRRSRAMTARSPSSRMTLNSSQYAPTR